MMDSVDSSATTIAPGTTDSYCYFEGSPHGCTGRSCCLYRSFFWYRPDLASNVICAILLGLSFFVIPRVCLGIRRRGDSYMGWMYYGLGHEVVGYISRIVFPEQSPNASGFPWQELCVATAPLCFAYAIYGCLSRTILLYGEHLSWYGPRTLANGFLSSTVLSMLFHCFGTTIADAMWRNNGDPQIGVKFVVGGLIFQLISLLTLMFLWILFTLHMPSLLADQPQNRRLRIFQAVQISILCFAVLAFVAATYQTVKLRRGLTSYL